MDGCQCRRVRTGQGVENKLSHKWVVYIAILSPRLKDWSSQEREQKESKSQSSGRTGVKQDLFDITGLRAHSSSGGLNKIKLVHILVWRGRRLINTQL